MRGATTAAAQHPTRSAVNLNRNWLLYDGELGAEGHLGRRLTGALLVLSFPRSLERLASLPVSSGQSRWYKPAWSHPHPYSRRRSSSSCLLTHLCPACTMHVGSTGTPFSAATCGADGRAPSLAGLEPDKTEGPEVTWTCFERFPVHPARKHASEHWVQVASIRPRAHRTYSDFGTLTALLPGPNATCTSADNVCRAGGPPPVISHRQGLGFLWKSSGAGSREFGPGAGTIAVLRTSSAVFGPLAHDAFSF